MGLYGARPVVHPSGADQAAVTLGNVDEETGGLSIFDVLTQAEVQALRDKAEEPADVVRGLSRLVHALRGALVGEGAGNEGASSVNVAASSQGVSGVAPASVDSSLCL